MLTTRAILISFLLRFRFVNFVCSLVDSALECERVSNVL